MLDTNQADTKLSAWCQYVFFFNALFYAALGLFNVSNIATHIELPSAISYFLGFFSLISAIGHMGLFAFIPAVFFSLLARQLTRYRAVIVILVLVSACAISIYLTLDSVVFKLFQYHVNGLIWQMILSSANEQIFTISHTEKLLALSSCLLIIVVECLLALWLWYKLAAIARMIHRNLVLTLFGGCLLLSYIFFLYACSLTMDNVPNLTLSHAFNVKSRAFPYYKQIVSSLTPYDLRSFELNTSGWFAETTQATQQLAYPKHPLQCQAPAKPMNLLVIVIDAWRFDMLTTEVTPNLYQFSKKTWQFRQHTSGGNSTRPGIFSLFYSLPANYWDSMLSETKPPVLMQQLDKHHYRHGIFASANLTMPQFNRTVFQLFPDIALQTPGEYPYQRDAQITRDAQAFLQQQAHSKQPFFSFVFYNSVHSYCQYMDAPELFKPAVAECNRIALNLTTDAKPYFNRYKNALHYVDDLTGKLLDTLRETQLLDNTMVLVTGDHGEQFNDNGSNHWGHARSYSYFQIQTPLLIYRPNQAPQVINHATSHYDVVPSLMHWLFDCQNPIADYSVGKLLTDPRTKDFLLVGSYVGYGILLPDKIIDIYSSGNYQVTDLSGNALTEMHVNATILKRVIAQARQFYK